VPSDFGADIVHRQGEPIRIVSHLGVDRVGEQARPVHADAEPVDRSRCDLGRRVPSAR
jgi:hypothetical protein